jgi:hypothetical protein
MLARTLLAAMVALLALESGAGAQPAVESAEDADKETAAIPPPPGGREEARGDVPEPPAPEARSPGMRRVRLDVGELTVYRVPDRLRPRHNVHPAVLGEVLCADGTCDRWLPDDVRLAVRRPEASRARAPVALPNGPGTAVIRAPRPRARRIAGAVSMVGLLGSAAVLLTFGVFLTSKPMTAIGASLGLGGLGLGLGLMFGAGTPVLRWTPGVPR